MLRIIVLAAALLTSAEHRAEKHRFYDCNAEKVELGVGRFHVSREIDIEKEVPDQLDISWHNRFEYQWLPRPDEQAVVMANWYPDADRGTAHFELGVNKGTPSRLRLGDCSGDQASCSAGFWLTTRLIPTGAEIEGGANWGAVLSRSKSWGALVIQVVDEGEHVMREEKIDAKALLHVDETIRALTEQTKAMANDAPRICQAADPIIVH
jgi:hypothetical protein